jgi:hypothetical protein
MSLLLYVVGALAVIAGALSITFGIPVKEFSFGDTLIVSGTVSLVGGLIVVGLGAAVSQLQRVSEMLGARPVSRSGRPIDVLEAARGNGRVPFPPKPTPMPKSETARTPAAEVAPFLPPAPAEEPEVAQDEHAAPMLRNPELAEAADEQAEQEAPASKPVNSPFTFPEFSRAAAPPSRADEPLPPMPEPPWRKPLPLRPEPPQPSYFDAMWKNERREEPDAPPPEPLRQHSDSIARAPFEMEEPAPPPEPDPIEESYGTDEARAVAVLKSGVVDGMGYTLYVDGSIEAELPDGTLRFASINELRAHLERTG